MDISVIIVNYNTYELTKQCIESVLASFRSGGVDGEIIVVDNGSTDGSAQNLEGDFLGEKVTVIQNDYNAGFAKANNIGLRRSKADYILLLNSDTLVEKDTIPVALGYLKSHPEYAVLGCKILLGDGKLDAACKRSFPTPMSALYHFAKLDRIFPKSTRFGAYDLTYLDEDVVHEVDCVSGAFMLVRQEAIEEVGGMDEDYFMYCEDSDWCFRFKQAGYRLVYCPETSIVHFKKSSWDGKRNPEVLSSFYDSMGIFIDKHYSEEYGPLTKLIVKTGIATFKGIDQIRNSFKRS